jgi:NAD(P)-dependent dehydrogenase (short-subunit alcohol dehydrogenase family)
VAGKAASELRVLITGASSGIGAAVALFLADRGYKVWGTTRDLAKVNSFPEELREKVTFVAMDVTDQDSVRRGVAEFLRQAGGIDILINNAGYGVFGPLEEFPVERVEALFAVNYFGVLRVLQEVIPVMREQRNGLIINITSLAGTFVIPFQVHYSATKYALEALTEGLRQELKPFGVKVTAVAPGDIKTRFNDVTDWKMKEDSPYREWAERCWRTIEENMAKAPAPRVIAEKVARLAEKKNPGPSYPAGDFLSTKLPLVNRFVSRRLREKLTRAFYRLD